MKKNKDKNNYIEINIPKKTVNDAILTEFIKISQKTNINGFRKGKIPIQVLQKKYGNSIYYDVFHRLMQKFFYEFINKNKIKIIGSPKYHIHKNKEQEEKYFQYSVTYELYPKIKIKNLEQIKATKINVNITHEDIKKNIKNMEIWKTVNNPIKIYDRVTINYNIYQNNKKLTKFDQKNIIFIVGDNTFLPELNSKIINHYTNDILFFKINVQKFHPEQELHKKDIIFKIKIIKIEKKQDKKLQKKTIDNVVENKLTKYNYENIKHKLNEKIQLFTQKHLYNQIIKKIIQENPISIPLKLIQEETSFLYNKNLKKYKKKYHNLLEKEHYINLELKAKNKLHVQLIKEKIIFDNKLLVKETKVQSLIKQISLSYKKPTEIIDLYNKNKNLKNVLKNIILEKEVMNTLIKTVKIIPEYWTFKQFINYNWKNQEELF